MARVAIVMNYPYEAFVGGEAAYVQALRRYLAGRGHRVDTLVSDMVRGRSNPVMTLDGGMFPAGKVRVRRAMSLGRGRMVSIDPRLWRKTLLRALGRTVADVWQPSEERWVRARVTAGRYDAVILMWDATRYAPDAGAGRVLALKGFFSDTLLVLGEQPPEELPAPDVARLAAQPLVGLNNHWEVRALRRSRPEQSVIFVGMGFHEREWQPQGDAPVVLVVGADTHPNRLSLRWLLDRIWPLVVADLPSARLRIVGRMGRSFAQEVHPGVEFVGRVPSLDREYEEAQLVVAPLVAGSAGVKTKVAEALSFARPLVTTTLGVDPGYPDQFGSDVRIEDDPVRFAAAIRELLADADVRDARARSAGRAFRDNFSNEAAYGTLAARLGL